MIINKATKAFQTINTHPDSNWTDTPDEALYIVDDRGAIAQKVLEYYPNYDFVLDADGSLTDVVQTEAEAIELPSAPTADELQTQIIELQDALIELAALEG